MLQSDWPRALWPISQKQNFHKYKICPGIQRITQTFNEDQTEKNLKTKVYINSKNLFWAYFHHFWDKNFGFLTLYQSLEKTNDPILKQLMGRRNGRLYFVGPFRLLPGVQLRKHVRDSQEQSEHQIYQETKTISQDVFECTLD